MHEADLLSPNLSNPVCAWFSALCFIHVGAQVVCGYVGPFKSSPSFAAHQLSCFIAISYLGIWGAYFWLTEAWNVTDRLYGNLSGGIAIAKVSLSFQFYDLIATLLIPCLRSPTMIFHHSMAVLLAYSLLSYEYSHYYSIFYLGMTELSAVPLCIVDLFKYFRELVPKFPTFNRIVRISFALMFLAVRVCYWPVVSVRYFKDATKDLREGTYRSLELTLFFMVSNILLTLLQFYWGLLIFKALTKLLHPRGESKKAE